MHKKTIIVVNGKGRIGKDTLIDSLSDHTKLLFRVHSSIDCIKDIARKSGCWDGDKSEAGRTFLYELKQACVKYCDLPLVESLNAVSRWNQQEGVDLLFVHIRELKEIDKFIQAVRNKFPDIPVKTLLITRPGFISNGVTDVDNDTVNQYQYDYTFDNSICNDLNLVDVELSFANLITSILEDGK